MTLRYGLVRACLVAAVFFWASGTAAAQDLSPAERQAAAEGAYDRGTRAFRSGDYAAAARWYETANNLAPAAAALLQAVRAHERARNVARAATLSLHLRETYGEERMRSETAVLDREQSNLLRVDITCESCELEVDGDAETLRSLYLAPDVEHAILAHFSTGDVESRVQGRPGERRELALEAPAAPVTPPAETELTPPPVTEPQPAQQTRADRRRPSEDEGGLPVWVTITGASLTAIALGVTIWSGVDTLDKADVYEMMPTQERLDEGRDLELRTNVLIGTTIGFGVTTAVLAMFTDWDATSDDEEAPTAARITPVAGPIEGGFLFGARGSMP